MGNDGGQGTARLHEVWRAGARWGPLDGGKRRSTTIDPHGSSLYRLLGVQIEQGYERAKSRTVFRDFMDGTATVDISAEAITVRFQKRAHQSVAGHRGG